MKQHEKQLQINCLTWFRLQYPKLRNCLFHVPNGGFRNPIEASNFKRMGVVSGVPDILFVYERQLFAFEMKFGKEKLTEIQQAVHNDWQIQGISVETIYSFDQFKNCVSKIIEK